MMTGEKNKTPYKIRVILADDHKIVRAGIRQVLEQAGDIEIVAEAENGLQAKEAIKSHLPDVAVLDIQMPGETGIEVARWAKENHRQVGILILTAYDDIPYVTEVLNAGANGYILKTAEPGEIIQAVREISIGRAVMDMGIARKVLSQDQRRESAALDPLTNREHEVLKMAAMGYTNKAIAMKLGISSRTAQVHLAHVFKKLQVGSRTEAVVRAISLGWITQAEIQSKA
jgi:DNA-binding NarL/FixJ family response regulator